MKHSLYSASGASGWSACAGRLALSQGIPRRSSYPAAEGTAGHELGEECIANDTDAYESVGRIYQIEGFEIEVSDELADAVQCYVDYVRGISGTRLLETRISYSELLGVPADDGFGTGDCLILNGTILHVIDAKFGRGYVNPWQNKQMILYGGGTVDALEAIGEEITEIWLHVVQPRVSDKPVPFVMTREEMRMAIADLHKAAQLSQDAFFSFTGLDDAKWVDNYLTPGESQCEWCPAAATCPALAKVANDFTMAASDEFEVVNLLEQMTGAELAKRQAKVQLCEIWAKAVEHETAKRLTLDSNSVPGYKMVLGREGNRRWADPQAAEQALAAYDRDLIFNPATLKTLPQVEKALKGNKEVKTLLDTLVVRNPAKPTLTTSDDPRAAWQEGSCADEFAVVP